MSWILIGVAIWLTVFFIHWYYDPEPIYNIVREINRLRKRATCFAIGHKPRGPVKPKDILDPVLYRCDRCSSLLKFDKEKGWRVYNEGN